MTIEVEDRPTAVNELLWIREAFGLEVACDVPPALIDTPDRASRWSTDAERARWAARWPAMWTQVVEHAGRPHDRRAMDHLLRQDVPPDERPALLARLSDPSGRDEFGDDVFDDPSYRAWDERSFEAIRAAIPRSFEAQPERRAVTELSDAWRRGLVRVVVLACEGSYVRSLGSTGLLVTSGDRADDAAYRAALAAFTPRAAPPGATP